MFDPSLNTGSVYTVAQQAYATNSTYANGAVCYDDDGDLYYFYRYANDVYIRNLVDNGDLTGNQSSSGWDSNVFKQIPVYGNTNVDAQKLMVAYNDSEDKFYVFHGGQSWINYNYGLSVFTKSAYNSAGNTSVITNTEIKIYVI